MSHPVEPRFMTKEAWPGKDGLDSSVNRCQQIDIMNHLIRFIDIIDINLQLVTLYRRFNILVN